MYTVGLVDDDINFMNDCSVRLGRKEIQLVFVENCLSQEDIVNWIITNNLKCIIIDYKLTQVYSFSGTELVAYINSELPDLPCVLLTAFVEEGIDENLVVEGLFIDKAVVTKDLNDPEFEEFISKLKQSVEVFENRLKLRLDEFVALKSKKENHTISASEEERFISLYKILKSYNEVDDIPVELLKSDSIDKMDNILTTLDAMLKRWDR